MLGGDKGTGTLYVRPRFDRTFSRFLQSFPVCGDQGEFAGGLFLHRLPGGIVTVRVLECSKCGESDVVDTWPGADSDELLDQLVRAEHWTYTGDLELCPECSEGEK